MNDSEREFVVEHLERSRDRVLALAQSVPPEQRTVRPSRDEWSVAELIEHIIVVEKMSLERVERAVRENVPDATRRGKGVHKDQIILENVPSRTVRVQAPDGFSPSNRWPDFNEMLLEFSTTRARAIDFARTTDADLRVYFAPHPMLKDLDAYQWLLMIASHAERHVRQAEQARAATAAPQ